MKKKELISEELLHHTPFTAIASILAIFVVIVVTGFTTITHTESTFEIIHYTHILVSGIATSAIFYKYKKSKVQALLIGITGTILLGTFSDTLFPFLGAIIFNFTPELHVPLIETPLIVIGIAILGSLIGLVTKNSEFPHTLHVLLSVFASLFYLIAFANILTPIGWIISFIIIFTAVIIPCCLSDIIFPLLFIKDLGHHSHHHKHH
jgi:hypothetical protein